MKSTVLLTGATGFVGSYTLRALLAANYRVVVLKRASSDLWRIADLHENVIYCDSGTVALETVLREHEVSAILHAACDQGRAGPDIHALLQTNVLFGVSLLQAAVDTGVQRFINFDTMLEAGVNAYALSKKQFAAWLPHFSSRTAITNLRLGNVFGPTEPAAGFLSWLLGEFERGAEYVQLTPGEQKRDFVHAADVASACVAALESEQQQPLVQLDVGSGELIALRAFVQHAWEAYEAEAGANPTRLDFGALPYRPGELMLPDFDIGPLFALGWRPEQTLPQRLRQTVRALRQQ